MEDKKITFRHKDIRDWVEKRGGRPARIRGQKSTDPGSLRFLFSRSEEAFLTMISWEDFFRQFDREELALLTLNEGEEETDPFYRLLRRTDDFDSILKPFDDEAPLIPIGAESTHKGS